MNLRYLSLLVLLFLISCGFSLSADASNHNTKEVVAKSATEDANNRCTFAGETAAAKASETSGYSVSEIFPEIKMKVIAQDSFNMRGFGGQYWPLYQEVFMETCEMVFRNTFENTVSPSYVKRDDYSKIHQQGFTDGSTNQECRNDGTQKAKDDNVSSVSKNMLNTIEVTARAAASTPYDRQGDEERWEIYLEGFEEGCFEIFKQSFFFASKGTVQQETYYAEGLRVGNNNFECKEAGKNDYAEGKSKTRASEFLVEAEVVKTTPYLPVVDQDKFEDYRDGFIAGCKNAYATGYEQEKRKDNPGSSSLNADDLGGCLIATAAYGTELSSEVQNLREIRNKMYETELGGDVMHAVNDFYYSFSPTVADWERQNPAFKEAVKILITPSMSSFAILDHSSIDSETGLIGYVVGIVSINMGMYFVAPAIVVWQIRKRT